MSQQPSSAAAAPPRAKTSGLAIASLVCGIAGLCTFGLGSIAGIILGIVGLVKMGKSPAPVRGKGLALAGLIISGAWILLLPVLAGIMLPAVYQALDMANGAAFKNNAKQLSNATGQYVGSHNNTLPPGNTWPQVFTQQTGLDARALTDPADEAGGRAFAMNGALSGTLRHPDASRTVLFFECRTGAPATGGRELLLDRPRHGGQYVIVFTDGHVETVRPEGISQLIWIPSAGQGK